MVDCLAYGHALRTEKGAAQSFGKGDVRGVIASESSNNTKEGGSLVPTIAFGVPGSASRAILLGAFIMHGLVPGPDMLNKHLDITYSMVWSVALANILGAGLCYACLPGNGLLTAWLAVARPRIRGWLLRISAPHRVSPFPIWRARRESAGRCRQRSWVRAQDPRQ